MVLRDPEHCPKCAGDSKVMESRLDRGYRWRRRKCLRCDHLWRTYESVLNPQHITIRPARTSL